MKTLLSHFCDELDGRLTPLLAPLDALRDRCAALSDEALFADVVSGLEAARRELGVLLQKVAEQRAYVIIFGPLKSGKSTLMNALAGAYVSEVTTLPAYPCMVYVAHGDQPSFAATRYDGRVEEFGDPVATRDLMSRAHGALVASIREVEARGCDFDPAEHLPEALRRIDIRTEAQPLAESGAVLVDTPGLYSRMKFGYDLMTREFRDAAASAIFVVKTDNLFLEQVFDEFADLLRLFSRIFLVVNLDRAKQDLQPDGRLAPSLERSDPNRILEAFESLSMNADVKSAWQEGRLQIYPIDLLEAASRRLAGRPAAVDQGADVDEDEALASFDRFTTDLTQYLNGSESLVAFLRDSLRQAQGTVARLESTCGAEPTADVSRRFEDRKAEAKRVERVVDAFARLDEVAWEPALAAMRDEVIGLTRERCADLRRRTAREAETALARWYDGDASFASLVREDLHAVLTQCRDAIIGNAAEVAIDALSGDVPGLLAPDTLADLDVVGLSLSAAAGELGGAVRSAAADREVVPDLPTRLIPVRRRLLDWLLLRSQESMRRGLFGPPDAPARPVSRVVKQRRLGGGRVVLGEAIRTRIDVFFTETLDRVAREVFGAQVAAVADRMRTELRERAHGSRERLEEVRRQALEFQELHAAWERLREALGVAAGSLDDLGAYCGEPPGVPESGPAGSAVDEIASAKPVDPGDPGAAKPRVRAAAAGAGGATVGDPDESA